MQINFKFLLAGGLAAFLNIFSRAVFFFFFLYNVNSIGFFVGLFTAFILMRTLYLFFWSKPSVSIYSLHYYKYFGPRAYNLCINYNIQSSR